MAVGTILEPRRKSDGRHKIVGTACGAWLVQPLDTFGEVEQLTAADIDAKFKSASSADAPEDAPATQASEALGWKRLAQRAGLVPRDEEPKRTPRLAPSLVFYINAESDLPGRDTGNRRLPLPEDVFAVESGDDTAAIRLARAILADAARRDEWENGRLVAHSDVHAALDRLTAPKEGDR